jgi:hypothetical protein
MQPLNGPYRLAACREEHAIVQPESQPPRLQRLIGEILFEIRQHARGMIRRQHDLDAAFRAQQQRASRFGQFRKIAQEAAGAMIAEAQMQPYPIRALLQRLVQGFIMHQLTVAPAKNEAESEPGAMLQFTHDGRSLSWKKRV